MVSTRSGTRTIPEVAPQQQAEEINNNASRTGQIANINHLNTESVPELEEFDFVKSENEIVFENADENPEESSPISVEGNNTRGRFRNFTNRLHLWEHDYQ